MLTVRQILYAPFLLLPLVVAIADENKTTKTPEARKTAIEKFLPTSDKDAHKLINSNNAYLARELAARENIDPLLEDTERLRAKLKETMVIFT